MFVRWKTTSPKEEKWFNRNDGLYYRAYVVESVRINGKPRQKQHYLAAIREGHIDKTYDRAIFWQNTWKRLEALHLSETLQATIIETLEKRVSPPTYEEVDIYKQEVYEIETYSWEELEEKAEEAFIRAHPDTVLGWRPVLWAHRKAQRSADKNDNHTSVGTTGGEIAS